MSAAVESKARRGGHLRGVLAAHPQASALLLATAAAAFVPMFVVDPYTLHVVNVALVFSVLALGLQFITGVAGQFSVGHVAFYGIGAYTSAYFTVKHAWPVPLGMLAGTAVASFFGALMAPITRLRGNYMAMATLAFLMIVHLFLRNEQGLTGGTQGMAGIPAPTIFGYELVDGTAYYYFLLASVVVTLVVLSRLSGESRFGRALAMIRLNETAASSVGVDTTFYKVKAFVISAAVGGFAGGLFAHQIRYIHPNDITLTVAILVLSMIVVGGLGRLTGAIVGAFLLTLAAEYMRFLDDYRLVLYGAAIIAIMVFMPDGLVGGLSRLWDRFRPGRAQPDGDR